MSIFARHLDLSPLRGRRRGLVRCRFHRDDTASLSIDLDRGSFHCFGCGIGGGLKKFAALVGEAPARPAPVRRSSESPLEAARREVIEQARHQPWAREGARLLYELSDWLRHQRRKVQALRDAAATLRSRGADIEAVLPFLESAARLETFTLVIEHELDDVLAGGRL